MLGPYKLRSGKHAEDEEIFSKIISIVAKKITGLGLDNVREKKIDT